MCTISRLITTQSWTVNFRIFVLAFYSGVGVTMFFEALVLWYNRFHAYWHRTYSTRSMNCIRYDVNH